MGEVERQSLERPKSGSDNIIASTYRTNRPPCVPRRAFLSIYMSFSTFTPPRLAPSASMALSTRTGHRLDGEIDDGMCFAPLCA